GGPRPSPCFFFQAEDGIRDLIVTGVQTCALPISLQRMGANITAEGPDQTPPLRIRGGSLRGIRYQMPVPSAQVKSAILLAGLFAKGKTAIAEETQTRDHTERMLRYFFVRTTRDENGTIAIFGDQ